MSAIPMAVQGAFGQHGVQQPLLPSTLFTTPTPSIAVSVSTASSDLNHLIEDYASTSETPFIFVPESAGSAEAEIAAKTQSKTVITRLMGLVPHISTSISLSNILRPWFRRPTTDSTNGKQSENQILLPENNKDASIEPIPDYVLEYAPFVYLSSKEEHWPSDISEHLLHITPYLNFTPLPSKWDNPSLKNLDRLNFWQDGGFVYLTSDDNVEDQPPWLRSDANIPNPYETKDCGVRRKSDDPQSVVAPTDGTQFSAQCIKANKRSNRASAGEEGRSKAPAILIVVDKGNGIVDAFWFYFYSFNLGNVVFNVRFGNHVGDWEHSMVRFQDGIPKSVFFSEHYFGEAYGYEAVEKIGKRPVVYSAVGTHAMYATPGTHPYILPWGLLHDETDRGHLWDPSLNFHAYTYNHTNFSLQASQQTPKAPTQWFYFAGHWGDKCYPLDDRRQYEFAGQFHYVNGPLGPLFKNLGRKKVCQGPEIEKCKINHWMEVPERPRKWQGVGEGEEQREEDLKLFTRPKQTP
ncbi:Vacuolar protein sorting-associated protein 62 [Myotisia sp. PD_48]|nr:Vacuolar protein sorting-associated protein 62 [Myotisia sp. PD_48]